MTRLAASAELGEDRMALARFRAAFVAGERALSSMNEHPVAPVPLANLDDPLPGPTLQEALKAWRGRYHIELEMAHGKTSWSTRSTTATVGLRILGNASAMGRNFLARDLEGTAEVVFPPLDANLDYADQAMRRFGVECAFGWCGGLAA